MKKKKEEFLTKLVIRQVDNTCDTCCVVNESKLMVKKESDTEWIEFGRCKDIDLHIPMQGVLTVTTEIVIHQVEIEEVSEWRQE